LFGSEKWLFQKFRKGYVYTEFVTNKLCSLGHAIAEMVSRCFTHHGGLGSRLGLASGICGGQSGVGPGFLRVLQFPLPKIVSFHQLLHHHHNHPGQLAEALRRADHSSKQSSSLSYI
jgi:hypothetical protein